MLFVHEARPAFAVRLTPLRPTCTVYSTAALFALYRTPEFAVYATVVTLSVLVALFVIHWMERRLRVYGEHHAKYQAVFKLHRFSYAAISGIVGSQSILFAKTSVELVMDTANGGRLFLLDPVAYLILLSMGGTVTLQIYWLNCGLARWDALYNVPVFQSFWILVSVVGGGVFYREFNGFDVLQVAPAVPAPRTLPRLTMPS